MTTQYPNAPTTETELSDDALDQFAGGHGGADIFIAGAAIGGILGGIADVVSPHTVVIGHQAPQLYAPVQIFAQPVQPVYQTAPPAYVQPPQQVVVQQPTYVTQPVPVVVNTGW